jgi:hypothetical protein
LHRTKKRKFASVWNARTKAGGCRQHESSLGVDDCDPRHRWRTGDHTGNRGEAARFDAAAVERSLARPDNKFSLDALIDLAMRAGLKVKVEVSRAAA